ncbi:MAG: hypothetical protein ABSG25_09665, partial [Bryobacteraceae bacterium]
MDIIKIFENNCRLKILIEGDTYKIFILEKLDNGEYKYYDATKIFNMNKIDIHLNPYNTNAEVVVSNVDVVGII